MYKIIEEGVLVQNLVTNAFIPLNAPSVFLDEYNAWLDDGNEPAAYQTINELKADIVNQIRSQRANIFSALDIMRQDELVTINTSTDQAAIDAAKVNAVAIQAFIIGLRNITTIDLSSYTTEAQMKTAVLNAYKALVAAAPSALKPRFKAAAGL